MAEKDLERKEHVQAGNEAIKRFKRFPDVVFEVANRLKLSDLRRFSMSNGFFKDVVREIYSGSLLNKDLKSFILVSKSYMGLGLTNVFCLRGDVFGGLFPFERSYNFPEFREASVVGVVDNMLCSFDRPLWRIGIFDFRSSVLVTDSLPTVPDGLWKVSVGFGKLGGDYLFYLHLYAAVNSAFTFSLRDRSWKVVSVCPYGNRDAGYKLYWKVGNKISFGKNNPDLPQTPAQYYNGSLYWSCLCDPSNLIKYDLASGSYSQLNISLPCFRYVRLGVLFGELAVCSLVDENNFSLRLFDGSEFQDLNLKFSHFTFDIKTTLKPLLFLEEGTLVLLKDDQQLIGINIFSGFEVAYGFVGMGRFISAYYCSGNNFCIQPSIPRGTILPSALGAVTLLGQPSSPVAFRFLRQPSALGAFTFLRELHIAEINLTSLPMEIGMLTLLEDFKANSNRLTSLPSGLGALTSLRQLNVAKNKLVSLPFEVCLLTQLQVLKANCNRLTTLPSGLGSLTSLRQLNVTKNKLTSLPNSIGLLAQLEVLKAKGNRLTSLPSGLGALTCLRQLNIANNKLKNLPPQLEVFIADNIRCGFGIRGQSQNSPNGQLESVTVDAADIQLGRTRRIRKPTVWSKDYVTMK